MSGGVIAAAWVQALGTFLPTTALAGSAILGLINWRRQILGQRQVELAETCLVAADDVVKAIRAIRGTTFLTQDEVNAAESLDRAVRQFEARTVQSTLDAFDVFRQAYRRASFFIEMPTPDTDQEFGECVSKLETAFRLMQFWERQSSTSDSHARGQAAKFRGEFLGLPPDGVDPSNLIHVDTTEESLRVALNALEDKLLPVMGGKRSPCL